MGEGRQRGEQTSELLLQVDQKCGWQPGPRKGLKGRGKQVPRDQDGATWS